MDRRGCGLEILLLLACLQAGVLGASDITNATSTPGLLQHLHKTSPSKSVGSQRNSTKMSPWKAKFMELLEASTIKNNENAFSLVTVPSFEADAYSKRADEVIQATQHPENDETRRKDNFRNKSSVQSDSEATPNKVENDQNARNAPFLKRNKRSPLPTEVDESDLLSSHPSTAGSDVFNPHPANTTWRRDLFIPSPTAAFHDGNGEFCSTKRCSDSQGNKCIKQTCTDSQGKVISESQACVPHLQSKPDHYLRVRENCTENSTTPGLEVFCRKRHTTGFVQTPQWDGQRTYPANVDSCVTLEVPINHVIMTSFVRFDLETSYDCMEDGVELYLSPNCTGTRQYAICGYTSRPPTYYKTSVLSVRFYSDPSYEPSGFRFLYSFHPLSENLTQLQDGKWNCSGAGGQLLIKHFICHPEDFCVGKEDKISCTADDICGPINVFTFNESRYCYRYIQPVQKVTWLEAEESCNANYGYLVSLNTAREWQNVIAWREKEGDAATSGFDAMFVGLQLATSSLPPLYHSVWQWSDKSIAFYFNITSKLKTSPPYCSALGTRDDYLTVIQCNQKRTASFMCETPIEVEMKSEKLEQSRISLHVPSRQASERPLMTHCRDGHATHHFFQCDTKSHCRADSRKWEKECEAIPTFTCKNRVESMSYTLVCDHRPDCCDESDEEFCVFPPCSLGSYSCANGKQCLDRDMLCDGIEQCVDGSDEEKCFPKSPLRYIGQSNTRLPPAVVDFDGKGRLRVRGLNNAPTTPTFQTVSSGSASTRNSLKPTSSISDRFPTTETSFNSDADSDVCPETHFQCPGNGYCLPVYAICNDVQDCLDGQDEVMCESYTCPGFYRCRDSTICLHSDHLCDGIHQCPQDDDELACNLTCPDNCTCYGHAFVCSGRFQADLHPELRYLDVSGTDIDLKDLSENRLLVYLSLKNCGITDLGNLEFPNLQTLDLSHNKLSKFTDKNLNAMENLHTLSLAFNPLAYPDSILYTNSKFPKLLSLSLAGIAIRETRDAFLSATENIQHLNLSGSRLRKTSASGFTMLHHLRVLDLRGCPMVQFTPELFEGLSKLRTIYAANCKLCCPSFLPEGFDTERCRAPSGEVSSCDALLRADIFRAFLTIYAVLALIGNMATFVYRVFIKTVDKKFGFDIFVTHLCLADFLMGLYLAIVGVADRMYYGTYVLKDTAWKHSIACKVAGFLSLVSSEVSAFFICLITLERFLVTQFPSTGLHFTRKSGQVSSIIMWVVGVTLAVVPFFPAFAHWDFYSQSGICIPLPITMRVFEGSDYAFGIMIVLNFIIFLLIALGQVFIFSSFRSSSKAIATSKKKSKEMALARRLLAVVLSDFLCWFPIGLLGLLAKRGVPVSDDVNVAMAIFVLPFNSALNPFLYTFQMAMERHRRSGRGRQSEESRELQSLPSFRSECPRSSLKRQETVVVDISTQDGQ